MGDKGLAVVVSGLFSGQDKVQNIIDDLEAAGYEVKYFPYNHLGRLPESHKVALAVGHSAGATRVEFEYGNSRTDVVALSSPTRTRAGNITHSANIADPVSWLGRALNPFTAVRGFIDLSGNPHSDDDAWDNVKVDVLG